MDYVNLDSRWLENQIKITREEVKGWPEAFREVAQETATVADSPDQDINDENEKIKQD